MKAIVGSVNYSRSASICPKVGGAEAEAEGETLGRWRDPRRVEPACPGAAQAANREMPLAINLLVAMLLARIYEVFPLPLLWPADEDHRLRQRGGFHSAVLELTPCIFPARHAPYFRRMVRIAEQEACRVTPCQGTP